MGVTSEFYILPQSSRYRPEPVKLAELVVALRAAGFLCDPKSPSFVAEAHKSVSEANAEGFYLRVGRKRFSGALSKLGLFLLLSEKEETDVLIKWCNSDLHHSGLKYPLSIIPGPSEVYYDIQIHLAADTVYSYSEVIDPFEIIRCPCGNVIKEFEASNDCPFTTSRLPNDCPACKMPMEYSALPMRIRDGWTGEERVALGGITYRFALIVDCGKYWPGKEADVSREFLDVVERTLHIKTRVFRDIH